MSEFTELPITSDNMEPWMVRQIAKVGIVPVLRTFEIGAEMCLGDRTFVVLSQATKADYVEAMVGLYHEGREFFEQTHAPNFYRIMEVILWS